MPSDQTTELPPYVVKAILMLDPRGRWTGIGRPFTGWLATVPHLVEGENFQLSSRPVARRARLTAAGVDYVKGLANG